MDLTHARQLHEDIARWSKTGDLCLYKEADERRVAVLDLLEERDPSPRTPEGDIDSPLDAFERQMLVADVRSTSGDAATVDMLFNGPAGILAPEWFRRQIKAGMQMKPGADHLLAASMPVKGPAYKPIYIASPGTKGKSLGKIADGAAMPKVTVTYRDKDVPVNDYGRALDFSYRTIRWSTLAEFKVILWYVGFHIQADKVGAVYNAVVSGDGTSGAAGSVAAAAAGVANLTYADLVKLFTEFEPFEMNAIIVNKTVENKILSLDEFKDPTAGFNFQATGTLVTPLGAQIFRYDGASDDVIAALDRRFAVKKGVEQDLMVEADKIIDRRIEEVTVSESIAYSVMLDDARKYLDMA